jgi:hypothetical protein
MARVLLLLLSAGPLWQSAQLEGMERARLKGNRTVQVPVTDMERARLKGIRTVRVLVENIAQEASGCDLTKEGLKAVASRQLLDGGIKVTPNEPVTLDVLVTVMSTGGGRCAAFIKVETYENVYTQLPHTTGAVFVSATLWEQGSLATGITGEGIKGVVRNFVDEFVTTVKLANR